MPPIINGQCEQQAPLLIPRRLWDNLAMTPILQNDLNQLLVQAAAQGNPAQVSLLLASGADPQKHPGQIGALSAAASSHEFGSGPAKCLEILIPLCDANAADPEDGWTALMFAANGVDPAKVELLAPVSDASLRNSEGETALMIAAAIASPRMVEVLLAQPGVAEAASSCRDAEGRDALMIAAQAFIPPGGHWANSGQSPKKCIAMLLPWADPSAVDSSGFTALGGFLRRVGFASLSSTPAGAIYVLAMAEALCAQIDPRAPCEPSGLSALDFAKTRGSLCPEKIHAFLKRRCAMLDEIDVLESSSGHAPSAPKHRRI